MRSRILQCYFEINVIQYVVPCFTNKPLYKPSGLCFLGSLCELNLLYKPEKLKKKNLKIEYNPTFKCIVIPYSHAIWISY
jgi:hypothetical protein